MYKLQTYKTKTVNTYEAIGTYVVGVFYDTLYNQAKTYHMNGKYDSITESYKMMCKTYVDRFLDPRLYKKTILDLHTYFETMNAMGSLGYNNWVDDITKEFIPKDYWHSLDKKKKDQVLGTVINNAIVKFAKYAVTPMALSMTIDNNKNKGNIELMQDKMLTILIDERHAMYQRFVNTMVKPTESPKDQARIILSLRHQMKEATNRNIQLEAYFEKFKEYHKEAMQTMMVLEKEKEYLLSKCKRMHHQSIFMKGKIDTLSTQLAAATMSRTPAVSSVDIPLAKVKSETKFEAESKNEVKTPISSDDEDDEDDTPDVFRTSDHHERKSQALKDDISLLQEQFKEAPAEPDVRPFKDILFNEEENEVDFSSFLDE